MTGKLITTTPAEGAVVDVRAEVRDRSEPFLRILEAASDISVGGSFVVVSPFEPRALYRRLAELGFSYESDHVGVDEWVTRFTRERQTDAEHRGGAVDAE